MGFLDGIWNLLEDVGDSIKDLTEQIEGMTVAPSEPSTNAIKRVHDFLLNEFNFTEIHKPIEQQLAEMKHDRARQIDSILHPSQSKE